MVNERETQHNLPAILANFRISGEVSSVVPVGSGHIHDTFFVKNVKTEGPDYTLQRINHQVFTDVSGLMSNVERVTNHIRRKLQAIPGADPERQTLRLVACKDGCNYFQDERGSYWRMYFFIRDAYSYDVAQQAEQAFEAGKAFGQFQALLADLPCEELIETIPHFHDIEKRLHTFLITVQKDPVGRVAEVRDEIAFVKERADDMCTILREGRAGKIPIRVTHNDTKLNNVLLDKRGKGLCVIDLDTVMPGYVHYDFGDSIRTIANRAAEDEKEMDKIVFDIQFFEAYAHGYWEQMHSFLTETEIAYLAFSGKLLTYTMGLRFLTDYIAGDTYYKIHFATHNLQRSRAQFQLLQKMEEQYNSMQQIIEKLAKKGG